MAAKEAKSDISQLINIRHFVEDLYQDSRIHDDEHDLPFLESVADKMHLTPDMIAELDSVCGLPALTCENEPNCPFTDRQTGAWKKIPEDTALVTLSHQKEDVAHRKSNTNYKILILKKLKYKRLDGPWVHELKRRLSPHIKMDNLPEALITIQVYCPYFQRGKLWLNQEFNVLGRQTLEKLRDKIECIADNVVVGEFSDHPDFPQDTTTKEVYKSGFFHIEGVFYNDMRDANSRDYSKPIMDWANEENRPGVGPFSSTSIEDVRFDSLTVRLGQPYLYQHQGDCEHLIIFSDIRLLHPEDCQDEGEYPLVVSGSQHRCLKCRVCQANTAVWITENSPLAPEDPCYFCDTCFRMLHYDPDGNKVGDFKAFPYNL